MSKELLFSVTRKDLRRDVFRSGGKGGQHQNTTESGVRFTHIESGAVGESRNERSQAQNEKLALQRLANHPKFIAWQQKKVAEMLSKRGSIEKQVEAAMNPENIRIETKENGRWVEGPSLEEDPA